MGTSWCLTLRVTNIDVFTGQWPLVAFPVPQFCGSRSGFWWSMPLVVQEEAVSNRPFFNALFSFLHVSSILLHRVVTWWYIIYYIYTMYVCIYYIYIYIYMLPPPPILPFCLDNEDAAMEDGGQMLPARKLHRTDMECVGQCEREACKAMQLCKVKEEGEHLRSHEWRACGNFCEGNGSRLIWSPKSKVDFVHIMGHSLFH